MVFTNYDPAEGTGNAAQKGIFAPGGKKAG
jgi:hypothetical protein